MLTTTVDGLWVLQVISGIEVLAPELGLRPHFPSAENISMALCNPAAEELRDAGVITADGDIDVAVAEWLTVMSRRDLALLLCVQTPGGLERIVLARLAHWWVAMERSGPLIRISSAGVATDEGDAGRVISDQIDRLCGQLPPAQIRPISIDVGPAVAAVREGAIPAATSSGLDPAQTQLLAVATDMRRSAHASLVAIQSGDKPHVTAGAVTIIDTPHGRLVSEHVTREGRPWMIVGPGSGSTIARAVRTLLRQIPAQADWYRHRKVV